MSVLTKRRTREHIIADLSVNYAERIFLCAGFVIDRVIFDYGYDLIVRTFAEGGHLEAGTILVQMKASDAPEYSERADFVSVRISEQDDLAWRSEYTPVLLITYDAKAENAYYVHYQTMPATTRKVLRIPTVNQLDVVAVQQVRAVKNSIMKGLV
jgi:hypothetical protein